jgi:small subunit ribosomal protein S16
LHPTGPKLIFIALGTYDPIPKLPPDYSPAGVKIGEPLPRRHKDIQLDSSRAKYWLGVGAQPSDPVWRLLGMVCTAISDPEIYRKRVDVEIGTAHTKRMDAHVLDY